MEFGYVNQNENFKKWIFYNKYCEVLYEMRRIKYKNFRLKNF